MPPRTSLSVIIPACQAEASLARTLSALARSSTSPAETIVVDDGSTDRTVTVATEAGATVVRTQNGPRGPAAARNLGARRASGDVLVFLDADVAVHPDSLTRIAAAFDEDADLAALFGSYDDAPADPGTVSQYRNLLHHFVHQRGQRNASTFWAGCGAIRREVFLGVGGFDERYRRASVEDIELGGRLTAGGRRIELRPDIQATHLKRWTFAATVRSDIVDRAVPWTRLILRQGRLPRDLNTSPRGRASAVAAWIGVVAAAAAIVDGRALWLTAASLLTVGLLNAGLYALFWRRRGAAVAIAGAGLHLLYLLYSSAVFVSVTLVARAGRHDDCADE